MSEKVRKQDAAGVDAPLKDVAKPDDLLDFQGLASMIELGRTAATELRSKNRFMVGLLVLLTLSMSGNFVQYVNKPEPRLLGETPDGRIRPLPLLSEPLYSNADVLAWSEKCVRTIYDLTYVNWRERTQNSNECLSDGARKDFIESLSKIGVMAALQKSEQGVVYATPSGAVLRKPVMNSRGYAQWFIEVPYRISIDGRRKGSIEVVMQMLVRRVSLTWRQDGLWVETYKIKPRGV